MHDNKIFILSYYFTLIIPINKILKKKTIVS